MKDLPIKNAWNVGATCATGPLGLGVSYYSHESEEGASDLDLIAVGGTCTVTPGLVLQADCYNFDFSDAGEEGDLVILSTKVTF